ncbi:MAG: hypothetical protein JWP91_1146 [Fibrobacteres bacterium]|nr:hypothetical protein [Fibrobacterota bacterium]
MVMKLVTVTPEERGEYVLFTFAGRYDYGDFRTLIQILKDECVRRGVSRAMFDITRVEGEMPNLERHGLGLLFAEVWGGQMKVAILAPRERINRLFENTAVNRYAQVNVGSDPSSLLSWLLEGIQ